MEKQKKKKSKKRIYLSKRNAKKKRYEFMRNWAGCIQIRRISSYLVLDMLIRGLN